jgi:hypothetical protein
MKESFGMFSFWLKLSFVPHKVIALIFLNSCQRKIKPNRLGYYTL